MCIRDRKECRVERELKEAAFDECHMLQARLTDLEDRTMLALEASPARDLEQRVERLKECNIQLESALQFQAKKAQKQSVRSMLKMQAWMQIDPRAAQAVAAKLTQEALGEMDYDFDLDSLELLFDRYRQHIPEATVPSLEEQMLLDHLPASVQAAPVLSEPDMKAIQSLTNRSAKKFKTFDTNSNGFLEGDELEQVALWAWSSFHPGGEPLREELVREEVVKILGRVREDLGGKMSRDQFESYFKRTAAAITRFRKQRSESSAVNRPELLAAEEANLMMQLPVGLLDNAPHLSPTEEQAVNEMGEAATQKFRDLDADGDGALDKDEVLELGRWVLLSFNGADYKPSDQQVATEAAKLLEKIDTDRDYRISIDEFAVWYAGFAAAVLRFKKKEQQVVAEEEPSSAKERELSPSLAEFGTPQLVAESQIGDDILRELFNALDVERAGLVTTRTMQEMFPRLASETGFFTASTLGQIDSMLKYFDGDGSNTLDFLEFASLVRSVTGEHA
eukprot:TRINITY_DN22405_c0_g1_i1.p1 TRINITY_DN22405_c0_g1~~TRINITY_DN22405_c0_g1_i1.p1  ORF type:complete len:507 (+),score=173.81 TRINITY_DN22405_c0_g1_i1:108-1628(+)